MGIRKAPEYTGAVINKPTSAYINFVVPEALVKAEELIEEKMNKKRKKEVKTKSKKKKAKITLD
jgi:hypothetical protein